MSLSAIKVYEIAGNIGASKTTLGEELQKINSDVLFIPEPAEDPEIIDLLNAFYSNMSMYALMLQYAMLMKRNAAVRKGLEKAKETGKTIIVIERWIGTDIHVFAKQLNLDGHMSLKEYNSFISIAEKMCGIDAEHFIVPDGHILLDVPAEVCMARIKSRNRECETGIPEKYLEALHIRHNEYFDLMLLDRPIVRIDATGTIPENLVRLTEAVATLNSC